MHEFVHNGRRSGGGDGGGSGGMVRWSFVFNYADDKIQFTVYAGFSRIAELRGLISVKKILLHLLLNE